MLWPQIQNWSIKNTFTGHWETGVDCIENIGKRQQFFQGIALEHNCDSSRTYGAVIKKFQWQRRRHPEAVYDIRGATCIFDVVF